MDERNWGAEPLRRPTIGEEDTIVISECGRVIQSPASAGNGTDYRSHWLCLVRQRFGGYALLVKHGGGEERVQLGYEYRMGHVAQALAAMDSDTRYLTLYALYSVHREATQHTTAKWSAAVASGKARRERVRGGSRGAPRYRVFIED